jgi:hypothetical protein
MVVFTSNASTIPTSVIARKINRELWREIGMTTADVATFTALVNL